jgi:hypothetical protein
MVANVDAQEFVSEFVSFQGGAPSCNPSSNLETNQMKRLSRWDAAFSAAIEVL